MYENNNDARIQEKNHNAKFVKNLIEEKNKVDKKYTSLLVDVKKWMGNTEIHVL
jgi:hypothetical protein